MLRMSFEKGNKVLVIDDAIKGIVAGFKNGLVLVKDETGMIYEFKPSELVKVEVEQIQLLNNTKVNHNLLTQKQKNIKKKPKTSVKKIKNEVIFEVDLHIEKLVKSAKGLDNYDILNLQIDTAKRKIEYCIQKRIPKIIFIHGIGKGTLKTELAFLLDKYPVKYYDASYQKYGLGATEVYIYQNM